MTSEIQEKLRIREQFFGLQKQQQKAAEQYYEDTFPTGIQEPLKELRLGEGRKMIDTACDQINYDNPVATREPRNDSIQERELQDKIEQCQNGILQHFSAQDPNPERETTKGLSVFGEELAQVYVDWSKNFPICVQMYDPQIVWPNPGVVRGCLDDVIVNYLRDAADIKDQYPDWKGQETGLVNYTEYHAPDKFVVEVGNETLTTDSSAYPFLTWAHTYAGLGRFSGAGSPETLAIGLLHGVQGTLLARTRNVSQIDSIQAKWAIPHVDTVAKNKLDYGPGSINRFDSLTDYQNTKVDTGIGAHPSLYEHARMLKAEIDEWSPSTLRGQPAPSVESGYGQAIVGGYARLRFGTILIRTNALWGNIMGIVLRLVEEVIKEPVPIWTSRIEGKRTVRKELVLRPGDIQGYYFTKVKLESSDPEAADRRKALGRDLWAAGAISKREMLEKYMGIPNATAMMAEIDAEKLIQNYPPLQEMLGKKVMERLGLKAEMEAAQQEEKQQIDMQQVVQEGLNTPFVPPNLPARPGSYEEARQMMRRFNRGSPSPQMGANGPPVVSGPVSPMQRM